MQGTGVVQKDKGIVLSRQIGFWSKVTRQTQEVINGMPRMSSLLFLCPGNNHDSIWRPRNRIAGKRLRTSVASVPSACLSLGPSCSYLTQRSQLASGTKFALSTYCWWPRCMVIRSTTHHLVNRLLQPRMNAKYSVRIRGTVLEDETYL